MSSSSNTRLDHLIKVLDLAARSSSITTCSTKEDADKHLLDHIATFGRFTVNEAIRLKPLVGLAANSQLLSFIERFRELPLFRAELYYNPKEARDLNLDLIDSFAQGSSTYESESNRQADECRELRAIALKLSRSARNRVLYFFFHVVSVFASLSSFLPDHVTLQTVIDVFNRYLSPLWGSTDIQSQFADASVDARLAEGWWLVNECIKVLCQELAVSSHSKAISAGERTCSDDDSECKELKNGAIDNSETIDEHDVLQVLPVWYERVLSEFLAYIFVLFEGSVGSETFLTTMQKVVTPLLNALMSEMKCAERKEFNLQLLRECIRNVEAGNVTMAEVYYDVNTMNPTLRKESITRKVTWNLQHVMKRCRDSSSVVLRDPKSSTLRKPGLNLTRATTTEGDHRPSRKRLMDRERPTCEENSEGADNARVHCKKRRRKSRFSDRSATDTGSSKGMHASSSHQPNSTTQIDFDLDGKVTTNVPETLAAETTTSDENVVDVGTPPTLGAAVEAFYTELMSWNPGPGNSSMQQTSENLTHRNDIWIKRWVEAHKDAIKSNVMECHSMEAYADHWKPIIMMEPRGSVASELKELLPSARKASPKLFEDFHNDVPRFRIRVEKVSHSRTLTHLDCLSNDSSLTRRIAKEMQGGLVCIGYVMRKNHPQNNSQPDLSIIACRSVSWEDEEYAFGTTGRRADDVLDGLSMSFTVNRSRFKQTRILVGDTIYFAKITTYSPSIRMLRSMNEAKNILPRIRRRLCEVGVGTKEAGYDSSDINPIPDDRKNIIFLESNVDLGCKDYLGAMRRMEKINASQHIAILAALLDMGDCDTGASSLSLIKGPPGTGKTNCITFLIGALMHHSRFGHVNLPGHQPVDALRGKLEPDGILRHSSNRSSFRFLVTASSNSAVDNVMSRVRQLGIVGLDGSIIRPEMCRVARNNYDYKTLKDMSFNARALPFDRFIHNRNSQSRTPSKKALESYKSECIICFSTLTTLGGPQWKQWKVPIDVVIVDEGAHSIEPETAIGIIATRKHAFNRRSLAVIVGDDDQLVAPSFGLPMVREHKIRLPFNYEANMNSMFHRLVSRNRATCCMLQIQYRMHPDIASLHFNYFYNNSVTSGKPASDFLEPYNQGLDINGGYAPFTCIDTSKCKDRFELKKEGGKYYNETEIQVINEVLWNLYNIVGRNIDKLSRRIAVLIPYRSQVEKVRERLFQYKQFVHFAVQKSREANKVFNIKVDTSDGMQGSECDIVIFAATRSNEDHEVGFLSDKRRLNVAMSRMKKLMVFIGDFSTLSSAQVEYFSYIDRATHQGQFNSARKIL